MGAGVTADKVELWFPVVARQAATITNFHSSIIARSVHTSHRPKYIRYIKKKKISIGTVKSM